MSAEVSRARPAVPRWWAGAARRTVRGRIDAALAVLDAMMIVVAYVVMLVARYDLSVPQHVWQGVYEFLPLAIVLHLVINLGSGLYGPVWEQASIREAQRVLIAGLGATLLLLTSNLLFGRPVPLSVVLVGGGIATGLFGLLRFQSRLFAFRRRARGDGSKVLIVGAGASAGALVRELVRDEESSVRVLALLDDDPRKLGRRLNDVPIVGTIDDLVRIGRELEIDQVLLAIPSATSPLVRRVADAAADLGAALKVLPRVSELMNGRPQVRDIRDLSIDDLLGREQIATDLASVQALIHGRRVLVTGGGGSIGSEIARQVAAYDPACLLLLDNDETHLFDVSNEIEGACVQILLDVRDRERVRQLIADQRPDIIFHAAAHKHVPLLEAHPCEAVATNVLGTRNLVLAANEFEIEHFVFISTDKAVNPSSVMGASKRVGEQLVLTGAPVRSAWCAVRFGNVLGSRGSVVPTFMRQIRDGGPVTLTHPDMTRFFMSIPEAVQLVLQAAALADDREVFMLDMGAPVRIADLANRLISLAGYRAGVDIRIEVTGLRPGEKLCEELNTPDEHPHRTSHPKIVQLHPALLTEGYLAESVVQLARTVATRDDQGARDLVFEIARSVAPIVRLPDRGSGAPLTRGHERV